MFKSTSGIHQSPFTSSQTSNDQSILEMAATNKSLAEQTLSLAQDVLPAFSLAETSLMLTHELQETGNQQQVEPTSAEKLAFQVRLVWVIYNYVVNSRSPQAPLSKEKRVEPGGIHVKPKHRTVIT